jgi:outer membrane protein
MIRLAHGLVALGIALIASTVLAQGEASAQTVKIGVVDVNRAIQGTNAGKKAKKELEDEFNKKKKDLEKREAEIKKMVEDFEKRSMAMNEEARNKRQREIQEEMRKHQEQAMKSQGEIQKRERDLTQPIVNRLRQIMEDIANKDGFTVILERAENSVMWMRKDVDLTDRLIREHDSRK